MISIHASQGAHGDIGDRFVACFVQAADDASLPNDPEFRTALRSYMEWAVAEVMSYSPIGSKVPSGLTMPSWSWDGLSGD